jgi:hypothetical protein
MGNAVAMAVAMFNGGESDEQLISRFQETGDQAAFTVLYKRYELMIQRMGNAAERKTGGRVSAEDMISRINERFYQVVVSYKPVVPFKTEFLANKKQASSNEYKASKRHKRLVNHTADRVDAYPEGLDYFVGYTVTLDPISEQLEHLRGASPDLERTAVMRFDGHTYEEIGQASGYTGSAATVRKAGQRRVDAVKRSLVEFYQKRNPRALRGYTI